MRRAPASRSLAEGRLSAQRLLWKLSVRNQIFYPFGILMFDEFSCLEAPFPIRRFLGQDVSGKGPLGLKLSRSSLLKAFCCPTVRL